MDSQPTSLIEASRVQDTNVYNVAGAEPRWGDRAYEEELHRFYGAAPYWANPIVP